VSENKLKEKLERLYRLAILRPEEENDEGRKNEARTSAFLLIKLAREKGVKIKFQVPPPEPVKQAPPARQPVSNPFRTPGASPSYTGFDDFFRRHAAPGRPSTADFFEALFRTVSADAAKGASVPDDWDERAEREHFKRPTRGGNKPSGRRDRKTPPLIVAAYASVCRVCKRQISPGNKIWWVQGWGSSHEECGFEELIKQSATG
jgi:hypothetical protein